MTTDPLWTFDDEPLTSDYYRTRHGFDPHTAGWGSKPRANGPKRRHCARLKRPSGHVTALPSKKYVALNASRHRPQSPFTERIRAGSNPTIPGVRAARREGTIRNDRTHSAPGLCLVVEATPRRSCLTTTSSDRATGCCREEHPHPRRRILDGVDVTCLQLHQHLLLQPRR